MRTLTKRAAAVLLSALMLMLSILTNFPVNAYYYRENGVDVSWYQGLVDWQLLAGQNDMRFVILRACKLPDPSDKVEKTKSFFVDEYFERNYEGARSVGLKVGCYCRIGAASFEQLLYTTQQYIDTIAGKEFDLPVYLDAEDNAMANLAKAYGKTVTTQYVIQAMDMIAAAGHHPGLYANLNWYTNYLDAGMVRARGYDLWLARYTNDCDSTDFSSQYDAWQYSSKGYYPGIGSTAIDLDVSYKNYQYAGDHGRTVDNRYSSQYPAYAYPLRDMTPYYADCVSPIYGAQVTTATQCYVQEVYTNGWCRVIYAAYNGSRVGYLPIGAFTGESPTEAPTEPPTEAPTEPPTVNPEAHLSPDTLWDGILPLRAYVCEEESYPVYEADCETLTSDTIEPEDECTVEAAFTNGWCRIKYEAFGETRTGYLKLSSFFLKDRMKFGQLYTSAEVDTYLRSLDQLTGSIEGGALIIYTGETEQLIQVIYAENGFRHVAWLSKREWYSILLKVLNAHVHGKKPLLERQVPLVDCDGDGTVDAYDLALMKLRLDRLPDAWGQ